MLLQPSASFSKVVTGAGPWRVSRSEVGRPFYAAILDGECCLTVNGQAPLMLQAGDFVLIPAAYRFTMSCRDTATSERVEAEPIQISRGEFRLGIQDGPPEVRFLVGHCTFGSPDAALLVSLLPQWVHVRGEQRLTTLVQLVAEESRERRLAHEVILARLLEVLLIEAFRSTSGTATASPGLLRGLSDERLAIALRRMHENPTLPWTVSQLAKEAALSRSTFFERFNRAVGVAPMAYLIAWRMALAKDLLRQKGHNVAEVAARVGYRSTSAFSVAFTRHVGLPPSRYVGEQAVS